MHSPGHNHASVISKAPTLVVLALCLLVPEGLRAQTMYWDTNGNTAGAGVSPSGTWATSGGGNKNWTSSIAGTTNTSFWNSGSTAVFSAGTDATGSFTVTVSGTQNVAGIYVEEGSPIITSGTLNFSSASAVFDVASGRTATVSSVMSGASTSFNKTGSGTLITSGANTYTGATNVNAGTLRLGAGNALPSDTAVTIASGATLDLNSYSNSIGSLSGAGSLGLGGGTLTIGSGGASSTFAGTFVGGDTGTFAKAGAGTLTFGAGMTLSAGNLVLGGGTLDLGGYSSTFGSLSVTADSILDFGTGGGSTLSILDSLTINSGVTLTIRNWTDAVDYFVSLVDPGAATLGRIVFTGFSSTDTKWHSYDNQITPVPEPSIYGVVLLSVCSLAIGWRRQHLSKLQKN